MSHGRHAMRSSDRLTDQTGEPGLVTVTWRHRHVRLGAVVLTVIIGAFTLAGVLGPGYPGYDASWSLVWGQQLAAGELPTYDAAVAPTPHPLANAVAAPLSLLGDGGERALVGLSFLSFAAALAGTVQLGRNLAGWLAGAVAALLLGTRDLLHREVALASIDLPFLALVVWAAALEADSPKRGRPVLVLLTLAGLLRPEAWLLTAAYCYWLAVGRQSVARVGLGAVALAAPVLWALSDLAITGNPLHSFSETRTLANALDRPRGLITALHELPSSLESLLGLPVLAAGLVGVAGALLIAPRRTALPLVIAWAGLMAFVAIGAAGLPLLDRYLLVPGAMLCTAAGVGIALFRLYPGALSPAVAAVAVGMLLLAAIPHTVRVTRQAREFTAARGHIQRDLRVLRATPEFREAVRRCPQIRVEDLQTRPTMLLLDGGTDPRRVVVGNLADGERGLVLMYRRHATAIVDRGPSGNVRPATAPAGSEPVAMNDSWRAFAVC